ncbi:MAG: UDP-3-O-(3-hydroxymyristoyl)glucosamine N-acyltransferase [Acidobacteriaceae bacterium]|nr:UDP-3-O-(3-hydroxymyristoyl)glucosamine N-acyltransferase [Acidobacteriaceae bacterium]
MPALTAAQIADLCTGSVEGDAAKIITGANSLEDASSDDLSFVTGKKAHAKAHKSRAGCLIVDASFDREGASTLIRVSDPRGAFAKAVGALFPRQTRSGVIHPTALIASTASIAPGCSVGPYCVIGEGAVIESGCLLADGCSIGAYVRLGPDCTLHARVTIYERVTVGSRVILHSGCVIGADGFGFAPSGEGYEKFPQIGTVQIGDDVEIGANCCIDRAALGVTSIGDGTKLDNLIHVGHNCRIGKHVLVAAQTGFSGSVTVGDFAMIGGQAGIGEKASIEARAVVGGKAGILTSQRVRAGEPVWGIPARPLRQHLKGLAHVAKLQELRDGVRELKRRLDQLTEERDLETKNGG